MMGRYDTPLFDALIKYNLKKKIPFHMPGHKQGKGIPEELKSYAFEIDLTELPETDCLHSPEGAILLAQERAAEVFGAKHSFFLVNGSTCGIQAMIASTCNPGDELIIDRNCHSSVVHSLILCGVVPRYVYPCFLNELGIVGGIAPQEVERMLISYPKAKGVLITSPTYYGICSDVESIAEIVHRQGKILLVDEAHGAHFYFHDRLPKGALRAGADMCVQSAHKTLPALTQSSLLHLNSDRIDLHRLKSCLRMFQTSSPSYILMAYLDAAIGIMAKEGYAALSRLIDNIEQLRYHLRDNEHMYCLGDEIIDSGFIYQFDLARIVIHLKNVSVTGYGVAKELSLKYGIQVEMADMSNIVCIPSIANTEKQIKLLGDALQEMSLSWEQDKTNRYYHNLPIARYSMPPMNAFYSEWELIPLEKSAGAISNDTIICFPPGIPVLCPGEQFSQNIIDYLKCIIDSGGTVHGLVDNSYVKAVKRNL
ncbi:MAG: aminotransferase class I/II-fold pyridoxal phosphate-dependent enzyme [Clostridiaceae bacterium]|nr:aminotransferase class I/II-fold pyridoxal phosphate-dependent enzyme [Clostridiaceae bacterium]